jgi:hypothetical protein
MYGVNSTVLWLMHSSLILTKWNIKKPRMPKVRLKLDTQMTISKKGVNQFSINSYHHFIITTNKENPIATTKGDRRKLIIRSSDEFIGNREYFNKMYALLENVEFIRTCYDYLKEYDLNGYEDKDIPKTEHQEDLQMLSMLLFPFVFYCVIDLHHMDSKM